MHDSDGLVIWNGAGERIVRPLNSPTRVITSSFVERARRERAAQSVEPTPESAEADRALAAQLGGQLADQLAEITARLDLIQSVLGARETDGPSGGRRA